MKTVFKSISRGVTPHLATLGLMLLRFKQSIGNIQAPKALLTLGFYAIGNVSIAAGLSLMYSPLGLIWLGIVCLHLSASSEV